jgi:tetratricopeptide (TPR) repeat protein
VDELSASPAANAGVQNPAKISAAMSVFITSLRGAILLLALTAAVPDAFPQAPADREQATAALGSAVAEQRAQGVAWIATHGAMADAGLLHERLRDDSPLVRAHAEQGLWLLWSRSGDAALDRLMARGVDEMQAGRFAEAIGTFSQVIMKQPQFAEGWNKRATAHYLAGEYKKSIADCQEVLKRNPRHFGALSGMGQIHLQLDEPGAALLWFKRALDVNPNMTGVELNVEALERLLRDKPGRST